MQTWTVQDAKARFSELLQTCDREGSQLITKRGTETAVLVPVEEWKRLQNQAKPALKALLLSDFVRTELLVPERGQAKRRSPIEL